MTDDFSPLPIDPIGVVIKRYGAAQVVRTVSGLAEMLLYKWPEDAKGDLWRVAMSACLSALEAQSNPEAAKDAFILAARDARIPIVTDSSIFEPPRR